MPQVRNLEPTEDLKYKVQSLLIVFLVVNVILLVVSVAAQGTVTFVGGILILGILINSLANLLVSVFYTDSIIHLHEDLDLTRQDLNKLIVKEEGVEDQINNLIARERSKRKQEAKMDD